MVSRSETRAAGARALPTIVPLPEKQENREPSVAAGANQQDNLPAIAPHCEGRLSAHVIRPQLGLPASGSVQGADGGRLYSDGG